MPHNKPIRASCCLANQSSDHIHVYHQNLLQPFARSSTVPDNILLNLVIFQRYSDSHVLTHRRMDGPTLDKCYTVYRLNMNLRRGERLIDFIGSLMRLQ